MRTSLTRRSVLRAAAATTVGLSITRAGAQSTGPITLIVPFAPGGATDVVSRIVGKSFSERINRTVLIENVAGAGGVLGAQRLLRATSDGTTLLMGTVATHAINPLMALKPPYDPKKDFTPISMMAIVPNVLAVNLQFPAKTVSELIALLKADPGKYAYGSTGNGTPAHLSGELFKKMAGVQINHVPYRGGGPAMADLIGGQIPILFDVLSGAAASIKGNSVRALAVTTKERTQLFPDVPTIAESGLPGYETYTWNAIFGPANMPAAVVENFSRELQQVAQSDEIKTRFAELSAVPVGSTPQALAKQVDDENTKWAPIIQAAGLKT